MAVNANSIPPTEASYWMGEYFRRVRLKSLGITESLDDVGEFEAGIFLFIDSQMDLARQKKRKKERM